MGAFSAGLISGLGQGVAGAATGGFSSLVDFGLGQITGAQQYKRTKKLMKRQHQYELENMATQDQYQRSLMQDADLLNKQALQKAGYSTADPNGTGFSAPTVSMPSTSASGSAVLSPTGNTSASYSALMHGNLMASEARLNDIEAKVREQYLTTQMDKWKAETKSILDTLPLTLENLAADIAVKGSQYHLNEKEVGRVDADIKRIASLSKGIDIDNRFKAELNQRQIDKLKQETVNLVLDGKVKAAEARLADYGILVGADWLGTLAGLASSGHSEDLLRVVENALTGALSELPEAAGRVIPSIISGVFKSVTNTAVKGLDKFNDWMGHPNE